MTAARFPETEDEIRAVIQTPEFKADVAQLKEFLTREEARHALTLFRRYLAEEYGPRIAEGLDEWFELE